MGFHVDWGIVDWGIEELLIAINNEPINCFRQAIKFERLAINYQQSDGATIPPNPTRSRLRDRFL